MNAFPLQITRRPMASRRLLWLVVVVVAVVVSTLLLVAAGLQRAEVPGGAQPGLLPDAPSTVQVDQPASGVEVQAVPLPGADIAPR